MRARTEPRMEYRDVMSRARILCILHDVIIAVRKALSLILRRL